MSSVPKLFEPKDNIEHPWKTGTKSTSYWTKTQLVHATQACSRLGYICSFLLPCILLVCGSAALCLAWVPFEVLAREAQIMSDSGNASFFTAGLYQAVQLRLRVIALGNLVLASVALLFRVRIAKTCDRVRSDFVCLFSDMKRASADVPMVDRIGLGLLTAIAAWLRFNLMFQPMRDDEASTFLYYAAHPFYVALSFYNFPNNHLFHTFLVRCSYLIFGDSSWALRLPVFVSGLLLIPATYVASRCLYRTDSALIAAALVACSSSLIEYATNARGYILICLISMTSIPVAAHAANKHNCASWFLLAVLSAIGFYTIPVMLYPLAAIVIWILSCSLTYRLRGDLAHLGKGLPFALGVGGIVTVELYAPVFAISGPKAVIGNKWVRAAPWHAFVHDLPLSFAATWKQWNWDLPLSGAWVLAAAFWVAVFFHRRCGRQTASLPIALAASSLPLLLVQRVVPFARVWLFALPVYLIVASAGLTFFLKPVRRKLRTAIICAAAFGISGMGVRAQQSHSVYLSNEGRGLEQVAIHLKSQLRPGDSVLAVLSSDAPLHYYFRKYHVSSSYLNTKPGSRVFVVVNAVANDTVQSVLDFAKRPELKNQPSTLVGQFDSVKLYEF